MRKRIKLTEKDLTRIVKRVIKEESEEDSFVLFDNLANEGVDLLKAMAAFCEKADIRYNIDMEYDDDSYEGNEIIQNVGFVDALCSEFEKILDTYY
jgi:hypothetical protein